ncbi:MAG: radical SAM protein [Thermoproteota archaeon]|nr:radical SAM protein [Thermoproteota archaeon]
MKLLKETTSVCPKCIEEGKLNVIPAKIIESDGKVLYEKNCEKHGKFQDVYWSDSELYKRAEKFRWEGKGPVVARVKKEKYSCPQDCVEPLTGLCGYHKTRTCLGIVDVTNRCNLRCPTCFANAGAMDYIYEPTIKELEAAFQAIKNNAGKAVQLTGGEPTVRNDLPKIAEKAREYFHHVEINTNAIRIARDKEFLRSLGSITFYVSYDTENDPTVYDQFRGHGIYDPNTKNKKVEKITGQDLIDIKKKAVDNIEEVGSHVVLVPTIGMNDIDQVWPIIEYALNKGEVIRGVNFQPVSFGGRGGVKKRATIPDLILRTEKESGFISRDDWYPVPTVGPLFDIAEYYSGEPTPSFTVHPHCGMATILVQMEKGWVPLPSLFDVEKLHEALSEIADGLSRKGLEKIFGRLKAAYNYYFKFKEAIKEAHPFIREGVEKIMNKRDYDSVKDFFGDRRVLFLGSMHFQDPDNIDFQRVRRCGIHQAYPDGSLMPFCIINSGIVAKNGMSTRDTKMRQFGISWQKYLSNVKKQKSVKQPS